MTGQKSITTVVAKRSDIRGRQVTLAGADFRRKTKAPAGSGKTEKLGLREDKEGLGERECVHQRGQKNRPDPFLPSTRFSAKSALPSLCPDKAPAHRHPGEKSNEAEGEEKGSEEERPPQETHEPFPSKHCLRLQLRWALLLGRRVGDRPASSPEDGRRR